MLTVAENAGFGQIEAILSLATTGLKLYTDKRAADRERKDESRQRAAAAADRAVALRIAQEQRIAAEAAAKAAQQGIILPGVKFAPGFAPVTAGNGLSTTTVLLIAGGALVVLLGGFFLLSR